MERQQLHQALEALGHLLHDRAEKVEVAAIGGGALALLGLIDRATEDIDLVAVGTADGLVTAEPLPSALQTAIADVASTLRLDPKWMNAGPTSLLRFGLPNGFAQRCTVQRFGGLTLLLASRLDQIHFKVFAAADQYHGGEKRGKHHHDLLRLSPSRDELVMAVRWARTHDPSEGFVMQLRGALQPFHLDPDDA